MQVRKTPQAFGSGQPISSLGYECTPLHQPASQAWNLGPDAWLQLPGHMATQRTNRKECCFPTSTGSRMAVALHGQQRRLSWPQGDREKPRPPFSPLLLPWKGKKGVCIPRGKSASSAALPLTGPGLPGISLGGRGSCARRGCRGCPVAAVHAQDPAQLVMQHLLEAGWQGQALKGVP